MTIMVDAHQHFWSLARGDYGWLTPALQPIYRDFGPEELRPVLARHGIGRTILVQAAPTVAETRFLLDLARRTGFVAGVVGWTDLTAPGAPDAIASLAKEEKLVGLRPMVQDIPDDDWLAQKHLAPAFEAMVRGGLVFDALVRPRHLSRLLGVIERNPDLRVVVDHGAKPEIRAGRFDGWAGDMRRIAEAPNVFCKLSGLATEAGEEWTAATLGPYVDHLLAVFGPGRLIWGSDWPVVELAGGYERWRAATQQLLAPLSAEERDAILGETAARAYRLDA
jgi:L-fuconolactonase